MASASSSKFVIYAALAGNLLVAITKFAAAAWTGSSAMLSEGVHSLVDTVNQGLMLYGIHRASVPPDEQHPLGHGREFYFWCFIVALLIFSLGAGISVYEGVSHILHPTPVDNPYINYIVLGLSFLFESTTWWVALREFEKQRGSLSYLEAATRSRDPATYLVLFEDSAALVGILIAFAGTFAAEVSGIPEFDGLASIGIGLVLTLTALFLARESKSLLIGEPAREGTRRSILKIALGTPGVSSIGRLIIVHLAPQQIVAAFDIEFTDDFRATQIELATASIEDALKAKHPDVVALFVTPKSAGTGTTRTASTAQ
ncbi:cation transporter [Bradyrhizobium sp. 2]|uniref:cation diffusion facilitator family transporter n=1 Tax=Bradyrhizobium sp. 2 TaxID=190045 RepID=UPI001FF7D75D|nr:cation diffusion facilitator family transporter [Bradyrhizobium sp. 2]MCK1462986.1 cation transporter [Bradyrhizobium sp. 2]